MHQAAMADSIRLPLSIVGKLRCLADGETISTEDLESIVEAGIDLLDRIAGDCDLEEDDPAEEDGTGGDTAWLEWHRRDRKVTAGGYEMGPRDSGPEDDEEDCEDCCSAGEDRIVGDLIAHPTEDEAGIVPVLGMDQTRGCVIGEQAIGDMLPVAVNDERAW